MRQARAVFKWLWGNLQVQVQFGQTWSLVFAAALSGSIGQIPTTEETDEPLQRMVESIKEGKLDNFIPFDTQGQSVQFA